MSSPISHYCQKCLAANPLGQDFCARCGTRLMLVVEPTASRFEINEQAISTDEHLLERISILENRLSRLTERLERTLDLLLRQVQNSYFDRSLIKTLISVLSEDGLVETPRLERLWNERCEKEAQEQQENSQRDELRLKILAAPPSSDPKGFADLVGQGFHLIQERQISIGIDKLLRAAEMANSNSALNLFIGEHFFRDGNTQIARTYLSRAYKAAPDDVRVSLLLGLTCADAGDSERAKELLGKAIEHGASCFASHYGLGWLHMIENSWRKALSEFKRALKIRPSPEAHFALASLYCKHDRNELACRHLRKALEMDGDYLEALNLLTRIYQQTGQMDLAENLLKRAAAKTRSVPKIRKRGGGRTRRKAPQLDSLTLTPKRLITGADRRLSMALREDALRASLTTDADRSQP